MLASSNRFEEPEITKILRKIRDRSIIKGDRREQKNGQQENPRESLTHIDLISLHF